MTLVDVSFFNFDGNAMRFGPGILPYARNLPGNLNVRFVDADG